ncbi:MAG: hypothetical protein R3F19_31450 [Verrucomicrobiales bacterium]
MREKVHVPAAIAIALMLLWWGFSAFDHGDPPRHEQAESTSVSIPRSESLMPKSSPQELMVRQHLAELYEASSEALASATNPPPPPSREDKLNRAGDGFANSLLYVNQDFARTAGLEPGARLEFTRAMNWAVEALKDEEAKAATTVEEGTDQRIRIALSAKQVERWIEKLRHETVTALGDEWGWMAERIVSGSSITELARPRFLSIDIGDNDAAFLKVEITAIEGQEYEEVFSEHLSDSNMNSLSRRFGHLLNIEGFLDR